MIGDLKRDPTFRKELEELRKRHRPEPKVFKPSNPISIDEWKYGSGFIAGFDLLYALLTEINHE